MNESAHSAQRDCDAILGLIQANAIARAGPACEALVARHPEFAPAWAVFAELWAKVGQFDRALECLQRARELDPNALSHEVNLARFEALSGQHRQALERADRLEHRVGDNYLLLDTLGNVFSRVGEQSRALVLFERALALAPDHPTALYNLATSYRFFGRVDEAEPLFERLLQLDPGDHEAAHSLSVIRPQTSACNHIADLTARLAAATDWIAACRYAYALGKEYDDLGEIEKAFEHYAQGASLMKQHRPSGIEAELATFEKLRSLLASTALSAGEMGCAVDEAIFVIGLPRTGSTLIERMLAAHTQVFAAGELIQFPQETSRSLKARALPEICDAIQKAPTAVAWSSLGRAYIESTRPRTGHTAYFIDKMPGNERWAALIHRALPQARFILTSRDPMDAGYALFRTLFLNGHAWTYDLSDIGRYLNARSSFVAALKQFIPADRLLEVAYEDLVGSPEAEVARMLDFLGLEWQQNCMRFDQSAEAVITASSHQVRQAVYTSSVGKWKALERQLKPLADALV